MRTSSLREWKGSSFPRRRNAATADRKASTAFSDAGALYRVGTGTSTGGPGAAAAGGLHGERLREMVVFELREDGSTEYSTMTLRALYNYVVNTITEACRIANEERHRERRGNGNGNGRGNGPRGRGRNIGRGGDGDDDHRVTIDRGHGSLRNDSSRDGGEDGGGAAHVPVIDEEGAADGGSGDGGCGPCTTPAARPPSPQHHPADLATPAAHASFVPPHLPSLTSSNQSSAAATPQHSNQSASPSDGHHHPHAHPPSSAGRRSHPHAGYRHHPPQRDRQTVFTPLPAHRSDPRERLGGYIHPRDMRRLVTPFSSSNEPSLMVRRHVVLLNFDPLRAVVLRDRLLVLVPDGADSILIELERRVRGGVAEVEDQVFGAPASSVKRNKSREQLDEGQRSDRSPIDGSSQTSSDADRTTSTTATDHSDEWEDLQRALAEAHDLPYELQSVDAVLQTVTSMLLEDARRVHRRAAKAMSELRGEGMKGGGPGEHAQERLRLHKDDVDQMEGRVQGFVRAMNEVLDDDEDMTLMNLGRLLTHPERFLQPVSQDILHEESDEPELILEAYLQQAHSIVNDLTLLRGQISTTEEQISMTLDAVRNRLLYINTLLSVASLCVALGSFVGSVFGMNLTNHIETEAGAFARVTAGTIAGMVAVWGTLSWIFYRAANTNSVWGKTVA